MARCKDGNWSVRILDKNTGSVSHDDAALSVLMDLRDELKEMNKNLEQLRILTTRNGYAITRIDKRIAKRIKL